MEGQSEWRHTNINKKYFFKITPKKRMSSMAAYTRISQDDAVVLFVDHQTGLCSLVQDFVPTEFLSNVLALAGCAAFFKLPAILTTSFETGPNGPVIPALRALLPKAPLIARPGQINAWDNKDFVKAVKKTGRKQLIIAGIVTDVCVAFPTLAALAEGFDVFVVTDASGTFNEVSRYAAWERMAHAGAQLMSWFAVASELQRDWRNDVQGFGKLLVQYTPSYGHIMASYTSQQKK
jgi:nicotinamidase-related amidase